MADPKRAARFKRRLSLPDLTVLTAVYALDFALLVGPSPGLFLLASWAFFVINLAAILLYAPRGWDLPLLVLLLVTCLAAVLLAAPGGPAHGSPGVPQRA